MEGAVHVAVGVIEDQNGNILIAQRTPEQHLGGYWEFPGGKVEAGETVSEALVRELYEEVNIRVENCTPLIQIPWHYPNKTVFLDVLKSNQFSGLAKGVESQTIRWVAKHDLHHYNFPPANKAIIHALSLPELALVTGSAESEAQFFDRLVRALDTGIKLVQLRADYLTEPEYLALLNKTASDVADKYHDVIFLANTRPDVLRDIGFSRVHLKSHFLKAADIQRSLKGFDFVSASVHNAEELSLANSLGIDAVFCSPVQLTQSHPNAACLGWENFSELVSQAQMPVYALGGMTSGDIPKAKSCGAQGIATIASLW